ncbi:hypothetical protein JTB14_027913 [Gonioctena quinquepunctata]|nr:hypothetical protein JTB14_027913 [Gonioctena quinquepunctata]
MINVRPVRDLLHLAHQISELKSFIYVSTAYSNCTKKVIEETIYPPSIDYEALICMSESLSEENMDKLEPMLLKKYPNTYTFTKQIAENIVGKCGNDLPVGIVRPAIIVSTYKEPIRAWVNTLAGPAASLVACGIGIQRVVYVDLEKLANVVPMDMCVNSIISAAWDVSNQFLKTETMKKSFRVPIYNFESNSINPITWRQMLRQSEEYGKTIPLMNTLWHPSLIFTKSYFLYQMLAIFFHWIPAIIADGVAFCFGKKPRLVDIQMKIFQLVHCTRIFGTTEWAYQSHNIMKFIKKMSDEDKKLFFCDLRELDWNLYLWYYPRGMRVYLVRESFDNIEDARVKAKRLYWIHQITKTMILALLLLLLWSLASRVFKI